MSDGLEKANEAVVALAEHYNNSDIIDEKLLIKFQEKMDSIQDKFSDDISKALNPKKEQVEANPNKEVDDAPQERRGILPPLRALTRPFTADIEVYEYNNRQIKIYGKNDYRISGFKFGTLDEANYVDNPINTLIHSIVMPIKWLHQLPYRVIQKVIEGVSYLVLRWPKYFSFSFLYSSFFETCQRSS